jgi:hypothetical protein
MTLTDTAATAKPRTEPQKPVPGRKYAPGMTKAAHPMEQAKEKAQAFSGDILLIDLFLFTLIDKLIAFCCLFSPNDIIHGCFVKEENDTDSTENEKGKPQEPQLPYTGPSSL